MTAPAETIIKDSFSRSESRKSSDPLESRPTETGGATWIATRNLVIAPDAAGQSGVAVSNAGAFSGKVALPAEGDLITIEAEVRAVPSAGGTNWVAIGLGDLPREGEFSWSKGLFLLVMNTGQFQCFANFQAGGAGPTIAIKNGNTLDFDATGMTKVKIEYDRRSHVLCLWVNEIAVVKGYPFKENQFLPDTSFAGFSGFKQTPMTQTVRNFSVTVK
ncbi:MAG: hypothetical protein B9S32_05195 [Verrucomicrobia bacterium Tous-C9LFEB]|nr:MAG: hypothetical protein B9S32_05195 [Verrucomicrobia bacterium Tous-C9LFEB]